MPCSPHRQIIGNNYDYKGVQHLTFDRILFVGVVACEWGVQLVANMIVDIVFVQNCFLIIEVEKM